MLEWVPWQRLNSKCVVEQVTNVTFFVTKLRDHLSDEENYYHITLWKIVESSLWIAIKMEISPMTTTFAFSEP